jgi:hypothetical protein
MINGIRPGQEGFEGHGQADEVTPDRAVEAMSQYGGTVLKTSLSKDDEGTPGRPARRRDDCAVTGLSPYRG